MNELDTPAAAYRRALRWYPAQWRAANEDAMVGTLLDRAEAEGRTKPDRSDLVDLAISGVLARCADVPGVVPSAVRDRVSSVSLAIGAAFSLVLIFQLEYRPVPAELSANPAPDTATFGPFASPMILVYAGWLIGFIAAMIGLTRTARWIIALTIPLSVAVRIFADSQQMWFRPSATTMALFAMLATLVVIGRVAGDRRAVGWTAIAGVASLLVFATSAALRPVVMMSEPALLHRWPEREAIAWIPVLAIALAIILRITRQPAWSGATLVLALPWTAVVIFGGRTGTDLAAMLIAAAAGGLALLLAIVLLRLLGLQVRVTRR